MKTTISYVAVCTILLCVSCYHELPEIPEPAQTEQERTPEFLGKYSGVYSMSGTEQRAMVIQLDDKLFFALSGTNTEIINLSIFSSVLEIDDQRELNLLPTPLTFIADESMSQGDACVSWPDEMPMVPEIFDCSVWAVTDGTTDIDPVLKSICDKLNYYISIESDEGEKRNACLMANYFNPMGSLIGDCNSDIAAVLGASSTLKSSCVYDMIAGGKASGDSIDFQLNVDGLTPSRGQGQCTGSTFEGAKTCLDFQKTCDFDSNFAGVYRGSMIDSDGNSEDVSFAIAVAERMKMILLYGRIEKDGSTDDITLAGTFDRFSDAITDLTDFGSGRTPLTNNAMKRGYFVRIPHAILKEEGDIVLFKGTWNSYSLNSQGQLVLHEIYAIDATRDTGVSIGTACSAQDECSSVEVLQCQWNDLIQDAINNADTLSKQPDDDYWREKYDSSVSFEPWEQNPNCMNIECNEQIEKTVFCDDYSQWWGSRPHLQVGTRHYFSGTPKMKQIDNENWCIEMQPDSNGQHIMFDEDGCNNSTVYIFNTDGGDQADYTIGCPNGNDNGISCNLSAPVCPFGNNFETYFENESLDESGCPTFRCIQRLHLHDWESDACSDSSIPTCGEDQVVSLELEEQGNSEVCVNYICVDRIINYPEGGSCSNSALPECNNSVMVQYKDNTCLQMECEPCEDNEYQCVMPMDEFQIIEQALFDQVSTRVTHQYYNGGCPELLCYQEVKKTAICPSVVLGEDTCADDEILKPVTGSYFDGTTDQICVDFQCFQSTCEKQFDNIPKDCGTVPLRFTYANEGCIVYSCKTTCDEIVMPQCPLDYSVNAETVLRLDGYDYCSAGVCEQTVSSLCAGDSFTDLMSCGDDTPVFEIEPIKYCNTIVCRDRRDYNNDPCGLGEYYDSGQKRDGDCSTATSVRAYMYHDNCPAYECIN